MKKIYQNLFKNSWFSTKIRNRKNFKKNWKSRKCFWKFSIENRIKNQKIEIFKIFKISIFNTIFNGKFSKIFSRFFEIFAILKKKIWPKSNFVNFLYILIIFFAKFFRIVRQTWNTETKTSCGTFKPFSLGPNRAQNIFAGKIILVEYWTILGDRIERAYHMKPSCNTSNLGTSARAKLQAFALMDNAIMLAQN